MSPFTQSQDKIFLFNHLGGEKIGRAIGEGRLQEPLLVGLRTDHLAASASSKNLRLDGEHCRFASPGSCQLC